MQANPFQPSYDHDVQTHRNEELDHRRFLYAPSRDYAAVSVFDYMDQYLTFFYVVIFHCMRIDGNKLEVRDRLGERHDTSVTGCAEPWNKWFSLCALGRRCVDKETNSPLVQWPGEVDFEHLLFDLLAGCGSKLGVSAKAFIWITLSCRHSLMACGSLTFRRTRPAIVITRCVCEPIVS